MRTLYPAIEPYREFTLPVSDLHRLHIEECGTPEGIPVVYLHGGPGAGISPTHRRFFDPARYRIVLIDQRGSGRSTPFGELRDNTTQDLVADIEKVREHLGIERWLKQRGVRTVHYVSPSVWAWREKRAEKIGSSADLVLCLFPMEPPIYARHGIDARFVGHPMADDIPLQGNREEARAALGLPTSAKVLAVLPGSRLGEISRLGEPFFEAAWQVSERIPGLHVVVPAANPACKRLIEEQLSRSALPVAFSHVLDGEARNAMIAADVVVLASGTATLEAMLVKRPMVVGYRVNELTYRLVKALGLIKVDRFALPNILAGQDLAPELMQHDCTPDKLAAAIQQWFDHPQRVTDLQDTYARLHQRLRRNASARAADAVGELLMRDQAQA